MKLTPVPPCGLLAPIVVTLRDVKICETGNYTDKFGAIHRHQFFQWAHNFSDYIPILLEHQPITWPFFGYVFKLDVDGENLCGDIALTRYGAEALYDYKEKHMGCGWSVGIAKDKQSLVEVTLCRRPRVVSTHVVNLDSIDFSKIDLKKYGIRDDGVESDVGDKVVLLVREIIDAEFMGSPSLAAEAMQKLQELMYCNNIRVPLGDEEEEEEPEDSEVMKK